MAVGVGRRPAQQVAQSASARHAAISGDKSAAPERHGDGHVEDVFDAERQRRGTRQVSNGADTISERRRTVVRYGRSGHGNWPPVTLCADKDDWSGRTESANLRQPARRNGVERRDTDYGEADQEDVCVVVA